MLKQDVNPWLFDCTALPYHLQVCSSKLIVKSDSVVSSLFLPILSLLSNRWLGSLVVWNVSSSEVKMLTLYNTFACMDSIIIM